MNILMLSQYFHPEVGATQTRVHEFAKYLAQKGHKVTVIAEFPNHPKGIIPEEYKGKWFERDFMEGFEVIRVWVKASPVKNFKSRMLFYTSYMLSSILAASFLAKGKYDVVFATSPPLFVGFSGYIVGVIKRCLFVLDIRDLWPALAVAVGELSNSKVIRLAEILEKFLYQKANIITTVTKSIVRYISS